MWLGSAAALAIGLPILAWGLLLPAAARLEWFVPVCDGLAVACMVVVAVLGSLDAELRQSGRSLPVVFIAVATAVMWTGHFVIFPGDLSAFAAPGYNQATSVLFLTINLFTPLSLFIALLPRAGRLERPGRVIALANLAGLGVGMLAIGLALGLGKTLDLVTTTGDFNPLNRVVGVLGLVPAAVGLIAYLAGRHGDERISAGVLAALTFSALSSISLISLTQRYSPSWYADHALALLPFVALLAGQLWLYRRSVVAEREAAERVALAAERTRIGLDVAKAMAHERDPMQVADRLLWGVIEALHADRATMLRLVPDGFVVERSADRDAQPAHVGTFLQLDAVVAGGRKVVREVVEQRRPVVLGSYRVSGLDEDEVRAHAGIAQCVVTPLVRAGQVDGVLMVGRRADHPFAPADVDQLQELGAIATLLIRNSRLLADAEWNNRAKSNFINLAAHEFGTPISLIRGYAEMLADQSLGAIPEKQRGPIDALRTTSADLAQRVEQLLLASRLEAGAQWRSPGGESVVDVNAAVQGAIARAKDRAAFVGADVQPKLARRAVMVECSDRDLAVIIDNLLNNAMTYSHPPARVRIEVSIAERVEVRVIDAGIGIPDHSRERIFDQFYRVDDLEFGYPSGTGLGLYISRSLADRNGAELYLERSKPREGSVFVLRLRPAGSSDEESGRPLPGP